MKIERAKVAEVLETKKALLPCHRCGHPKFSLLDEFANIMIQKEISGSLVIGGPSIPAALVVCDNCGAITFHAIGALGLLPPQSEVKQDGQ
ncbi:MAG: hypothetical protein Q8M71_01630 [Thermodesulfovibrionales bacterium]|nr:hypothetical protein [Thermodesulfovibrionales bacterium]